MLKSHLVSMGYDPKLYSGHSFRRGAATWALQVGIPTEVIQVLGDWKSESYKNYIDISYPIRQKYIKHFSYSIPK